MNRLSTIIIAIGLAAGALAQDMDVNDCIVKSSSAWGRPCEKCEFYKEGYKRDFSGTYRIELQNTCPQLVEVKVAMQEKNGTWRTFPVKALAPNEVLTAFACQGTGKYLYWVRRVNATEIVLPSDQEILTEYRGR